MNPKDLLDPEKMKKFEENLKRFKLQRTKEKTPEIIKKLDNQDNASRLNQMGQEGIKMMEWGVEPEENDVDN